MNEFDNCNGFLMEKGEKLFTTSNRSFKYGDGIFETIKIFDGKIMYWEEHYSRLKKGLDTLKLDDTNFPKEKWEDELIKLIYKNYYQYAKLRLTVYRDAPGLYTPMGNKLGYLIEGVRYSLADISKQNSITQLGVFESMKKGIDFTSNCKTTSALIYVMAAMHKKEMGLDDVIIFNQNNQVCESSNSNVFIVKNKVIYTPPLSAGCVEGIMRKVVIERCKLKNKSIEEKELTLEDLKTADEIFLSNAIAGVQLVSYFLGVPKESNLTKEIQSFF